MNKLPPSKSYWICHRKSELSVITKDDIYLKFGVTNYPSELIPYAFLGTIYNSYCVEGRLEVEKSINNTHKWFLSAKIEDTPKDKGYLYEVDIGDCFMRELPHRTTLGMFRVESDVKVLSCIELDIKNFLKEKHNKHSVEIEVDIIKFRRDYSIS